MQVFLCPQNVYPGSKAEFRPRTHSFSSSSNRPICRRDGPASHEQPASLGCISPDALCSLVMTPVFGTLHFFGPSESHDGHKFHSKNRTWDHMAGFLRGNNDTDLSHWLLRGPTRWFQSLSENESMCKWIWCDCISAPLPAVLFDIPSSPLASSRSMSVWNFCHARFHCLCWNMFSAN